VHGQEFSFAQPTASLLVLLLLYTGFAYVSFCMKYTRHGGVAEKKTPFEDFDRKLSSFNGSQTTCHTQTFFTSWFWKLVLKNQIHRRTPIFISKNNEGRYPNALKNLVWSLVRGFTKHFNQFG